MLHVVDADDELMWTDDHNPPTPTPQWKPGQTVEYTRTVFVPDLSVRRRSDACTSACIPPKTQTRLTLEGEDVGQRAYRAGRLQLQPQSENLFTVFKDGWHPAEVAEHNAVGRMAVDQEAGDAGVQEPEEGRHVLSGRRQPGRRLQRERSR